MKPLLHCFALALITLSACSDPSTTRVRLAVEYDAAWDFTEFEIETEMVLRRAEPAAELLLFIPDDWTGDLGIVVRAYRDGLPVAAGRTTVRPVVGEEVRGTLALSRLPCGDWCTPGSRRCEDDGVSECVEAAGCTVWEPAVPCDDGSPFCSFGRCSETCVDECAEGETRCAGLGTRERCGQFDSDPCQEWGDATACASGELCNAGTCGDGCVSECEPGAMDCRDGGITHCVDANADGCFEWSPSSPCAEGESCSSGTCVPEGECIDECEVGGCTADGRFVECGNFDLDECREPSPGTLCASSDGCSVGACTPSGCSITPRICDTPPEPTCLDANTLEVFDSAGTCSDGACAYERREVSCANCPACDACDAIVCDSPPSACFAASGTCTDGSCSYEPIEGTCDDGDPCTQMDQCNGGVCEGSPVRCDTPPPATCIDENTLEVYEDVGSCGVDGCAYDATRRVCPLGCMDAQCLELDPSNIRGDLLDDSLADFTIPRGEFELNTDTGSIVNVVTSENLRPAGAGVQMGVRFEAQGQLAPYPNIGIFAMNSLTIEDGATITVVGSNALILLSADAMTIGGVIDAGADGRNARAGGWSGGRWSAEGGSPGEGPGSGGSGLRQSPAFMSPRFSGGGGGGHGGVGGRGNGRAGASIGGIRVADSRPSPLGGGSGGGGGSWGSGGGGGGAVQFVSYVSIHISFSAIVRVPGGGGFRTEDERSAGGGGAGGSILLQAPSVTVAGTLAANGGGGGAFEENGERGRDDGTRAVPLGGAGSTPDGLDAERFGGGGGAAGWIHVMAAGEAVLEGTLTPTPTQSPVPVRMPD